MTKMLIVALALCGITAANAAEMPKPRPLDDKERSDLLRSLSARFAVPKEEKLELQAAGVFRFAGDANYLFIDRGDLGSVIFERASYGMDLKPLDQKLYSREVLLPRLARLLAKLAPTSEPPMFAQFQDEFAGAAPVKKGEEPVDPRKVAVLVARTAAYVREIDSVPVFGSELIAGLDRDGTIGRLRVHWPAIDPKLVQQAQKLQRVVASGDWRPPKEALGEGAEILETTAGVGHSAMADPEFRSAAVVRVLVRTTTLGMEHPISSTTVRYFDAGNRELTFSAFPEDVGSDPKGKEK